MSKVACPCCGGTLDCLGAAPPSKYPAIRSLGIKQTLFRCSRCGDEYVKSHAPVKEAKPPLCISAIRRARRKSKVAV